MEERRGLQWSIRIESGISECLFRCINRGRESSLREVMLMLSPCLVLSFSWLALRRMGIDRRRTFMKGVMKEELGTIQLWEEKILEKW